MLVLKATIEPRGDVAGADGYSPYPGSINQLLLALEPYARTLERTGGSMPEFVNPKYADALRSKFKSPTRLECMMQDYPKSLSADARVGFTISKGAITFSPVKTNLKDARVKSEQGMPTYSAASGEADVYASACEYLAAAGVPILGVTDQKSKTVVRAGVCVSETPRVVIDPSFATSLAEWRSKLPTPSEVRLAPGSTLLLLGELDALTIDSLSLVGTLVLRVCAGATVRVRGLVVDNAGWAFEELGTGEAPEELAVRGYKLTKRSQFEIDITRPGDYVVDEKGVTRKPPRLCYNGQLNVDAEACALL